jgi:urease accessory protein
MRNLILPLGLLAATPAWAHHPLGGEAPGTLFHGLLSGLAHPVIGVDHLAFVVLVGIAAAASGRMLLAPGAFILATMVGTLVQLGGIGLPLAELVIALSVVVLGAVLFLGRAVDGVPALGGFAFAGLFHGWAYGEAVLGSEMGPIGAYLAGFGLIQFAIAAGVAVTVTQLAAGPQAMRARLAAAVCCGIGVAFAVEALETLVL